MSLINKATRFARSPQGKRLMSNFSSSRGSKRSSSPVSRIASMLGGGGSRGGRRRH